MVHAILITVALFWAGPSWADVAWFVAPYKRAPSTTRIVRYCAMDDFTAQIQADAGTWREVEGLGNRCFVKVRASASTIAAINAAPGFARIPLARLDDPVSSLTANQKTALRQLLLNGGYTLADLNAAIPNLNTATLRDVLRFAVSRRNKPRYDQPTDSIVLDGPNQPTGDIDALDGTVQ